MLWFFLALSTAVTYAGLTVVSKKLMKTFSEREYVFLRYALSSLVLLPTFLALGLVKVYTSWDFLAPTIISLPLNLIAAILMFRAIRVSSVKETVPLLNLTPLFLIFTSGPLSGDVISLTGLAGILLIVAGAYTLNAGGSILQPFRSVLKSPGPRMALIVALIYSVTSSLDSNATRAGDPFTYILLFNLFLSIDIPFKSRDLAGRVRKNFSRIMLSVFLSICMFLGQMYALYLANPSYVISIKRTSALFALVFSSIYLKEKIERKKYLGSILMCAGIFLMYFA